MKKYTKNQNTSPSKRRLAIYALSTALAAIATIVLLETMNITSLRGVFSQNVETSQEGNTPPPVNDIDYSPATPTDNADVEAKKEDGSIDEPIQKPNDPEKPIGIVLSAAGQDVAGGPVIVRSILSNITGGTCTLTLTKNDQSKSYTASITWAGTYYTCGGFDIPLSEISPGTWDLELIAANDDYSGAATKTIQVEMN